MLDAITDFWKPMKKNPAPAKPKISELQINSTVGFGFVPQATLSGRRLRVSAINSYQFGTEILTSFVLSQEKDPDISMIVADAQGEQYLAISRRISISDRIKLFDDSAIEDIINKLEVTRLNCRDNLPELKGWLVGAYKREIQSMNGHIFKKDIRKGTDGDTGEEFNYSLLVSDSNEHALEIEKYSDGRIEVYATIYRRTNDIGEILNPTDTTRADVKLVTKSEDQAQQVPQTLSAPVLSAAPIKEKLDEIKSGQEKPQEPVAEPIKLEFTLPQLTVTPLAPAIEKAETIIETKAASVVAEEKKPENKPQENTEMATIDINTNTQKTHSGNGFGQAVPSNIESQLKQEISAVTKPAAQDNESIACELHVANQIIEEALRQEMRLSDVVRRIIALPVADKQEVHIPVTLADNDYALLAIRYGISASDRNAIKLRIIEELNDFSGSKKPHVKAA